jgi:hypothetical protein
MLTELDSRAVRVDALPSLEDSCTVACKGHGDGRSQTAESTADYEHVKWAIGR